MFIFISNEKKMKKCGEVFNIILVFMDDCAHLLLFYDHIKAILPLEIAVLIAEMWSRSEILCYIQTPFHYDETEIWVIIPGKIYPVECSLSETIRAVESIGVAT